MANYTPKIVHAGTVLTVHNGPGALLALVISHAQAGAQTVTIYDGLNTNASPSYPLVIPPSLAPFSLSLRPPHPPFLFDNGLTIDPQQCEVWAFAIGT